jgi:hypothetical protein
MRASVSLLLAAASILATLVNFLAPAITVLGFTWALLVVVVIDGNIKRETLRAAVIQEAFDTRLYRMDWNFAGVGPPVAAEDLHQLIRQFRKQRDREDRIRDWYPDTSGVHWPYDVLLCQQTNLSWDARLRRRYATLLFVMVVFWTVLGIVVAIAAELTVIQALLRWYVPSLAALRLGLETRRTQQDVAAERERLLTLIRAELDRATPGPITSGEQTRLLTLSRGIQDGIFTTRRQISRVPGWLYKRFRTGDEEDMHRAAERDRIRLATPG